MKVPFLPHSSINLLRLLLRSEPKAGDLVLKICAYSWIFLEIYDGSEFMHGDETKCDVLMMMVHSFISQTESCRISWTVAFLLFQTKMVPCIVWAINFFGYTAKIAHLVQHVFASSFFMMSLTTCRNVKIIKIGLEFKKISKGSVGTIPVFQRKVTANATNPRSLLKRVDILTICCCWLCQLHQLHYVSFIMVESHDIAVAFFLAFA